MKIHAIGLNVYKHYKTDCSNNGISSKYSEILVECADGYVELDTDNLPENFCIINKRHLFGKDYYNLIPKHLKDSGKWSSFGGCFAYSSDSRFEFDYPLPIHDRVE